MRLISQMISKSSEAHESGELMTTGFTKPSKGKYAEGDQGTDGPCGETGVSEKCKALNVSLEV